MPDNAANSLAAGSPYETSTVDGGSSVPNSNSHCSPPPPPVHRGSAIADCTTTSTLPPTVTPATTTRQSVSLSTLSTLWLNGSSPIPAIITHAPSPEAQEPPSDPNDLTTSTSSVPSTTTTLTNTLPPSQSAALRALNAPAFQSSASSTTNSKPKSTSSRTTLSSQPVVVRTYSGPRHNSRPASAPHSPRFFASMSGHPSQRSALSAGLAARSERLPSVDDFSFSAILRAVDPEIRDAIDAIAEICARSRLSLADEYDAHLPPQGEITGTGPGWAGGMGGLVGRGRISRMGQGWSAADNPLTAVPEASSFSERLDGGGSSRGNDTAGGSKRRTRSAYGSLKSVISGGSDKKVPTTVENVQPPQANVPQETPHRFQGPAWMVNPSSSTPNHPSIALITSPQASKQLSLDLSSTITDVHETSSQQLEPLSESKDPQRTHRRNLSAISVPTARTRSSTLSSLASWIPWTNRASDDSSLSEELTKAEARLREMLVISQTSALGKGKAPMGAT